MSDSNTLMLIHSLLILAAYLFGSLSTAVIAGRVLGLPDPRSQGSGNPGATNMLRIGGKKAGIITLLGDMLKGLVPVLLAQWLTAPAWVLAMVALAAFLGHLFPVFFGFKGGKGVATALGVMLGLHWPLGLAVIATWLVMAGVFRISSLAALTACAMAPLYCWLMRPEPYLVAALALMTALLFWRHKENIQRLLAGTESRIGSK